MVGAPRRKILQNACSSLVKIFKSSINSLSVKLASNNSVIGKKVFPGDITE